MWIIVLFLSLAAGWFVARGLTDACWVGPAWTAVVGEAALAILFGAGLASVLGFIPVAFGVASPAVVFAAMTVLAAVCAGAWWKFREPVRSAAPAGSRRFPYTWALWLAFGIGLVLLIADFQAASAANPDGAWDAISIWNLRARYLAGASLTGSPDLWRRAVSDQLGGHMAGAAHPGYPLFLSGFIALEWIASGSFTTAVPTAVSLVVVLAVIGLLCAAVARSKSTALALLAGLLLLGSELFVSQAGEQYSDLLESLAFLSALVLLASVADAPAGRETRLLIAAGLAAGFAPWIKNEGLAFAIAMLAVCLWRFRVRGLVRMLVGAAPGLAATVAVKLVVQGRESMFPATAGELLGKIGSVSRWWQALLGFAQGIYDAGPLWAHPVLLAAALALALRLVPADQRRARRWLWIPLGVTIAAEYGLYLVTAVDLDWHISTSVRRLIVQVWPPLIWLACLSLRAPEEYFEPAAVPVSGKSQKRRKARAGPARTSS